MRYVPPAERRRVSSWSVVEQQTSTVNDATFQASRVISYLIAGPVGYGAIGYGLDSWLGTVFLVPVGILIGFALSLYTVWLRYSGTQSTGHSSPPTGRTEVPGTGEGHKAFAGNERTFTEEIS